MRNKIASPADLGAKLERLLAYTQGPKPARAKLAAALRRLATDLTLEPKLPGVPEGSEANDELGFTPVVSDHLFEQTVRTFASQAGASAVTGEGRALHVYWKHLTENDYNRRPGAPKFAFTLMFLYKVYYNGHVSFEIWSAFNNKSFNRVFTRQFYGPNDDGQKLLSQFSRRLQWTKNEIKRQEALGAEHGAILVPRNGLRPQNRHQ